MALPSLFVTIGAKIDSFESAMGTVSQRLNAVNRDANTAFGGIDRLAGRFETFGTIVGGALTGLVSLPIAGVGIAATTAAGEFEAAFNKIQALGDNITGPALERLRQLALKLGADTKFSAQEAADGMAVFAAAGFNAEQTIAVMPGTVALAAAGMFSIGEAAEITKNVLGQFQFAAGEAGHVADVLAQISADTSAKMNDLGTTLTYVGPVAHTAGQSLEETGAALVALDKAGIQAEKAGTGLRGVLGSILDPSKKAKEEMIALGVSISDQQGNILPLSDIMEQFRTKLGNVGDQSERSRILFEIFGRESASAASILIQTGGGALDQFEQKLINSDGAADRMAKTMNQGLAFSVDQFKGSVETASIVLGTALLPVVTKLIDQGTLLINNFAIPAFQWFGKLPEPVQASAFAVLALTAAVGPALLIAGQFATSITALLPSITAMSGALAGGGGAAAGAGGAAGAASALAAALPLVGVALAGVAAAWVAWKFQDDLPGIVLLTTAFSTVRDWTLLVWEAFKFVGGYVIDTLRPAFTAVVETVGGLLAPAFNYLKDTVMGFLSPAGTALINFFKWLWENIPNVNQSMRDLRNYLKGGEDPAKDLGNALGALNAKAVPLHEQLGVVIEKTKPLKTEFPKLTDNTNDLAKATKALKDETQKSVPENEAQARALEILKGEAKKAHDALVDYNARVLLGRAETVNFTEVTRDLAEIVGNADTSIGNLSSITLPPFVAQMNQLSLPTDTFREALKQLGITGSYDLQLVADKAAAARDVVLGSGFATDFEKKTAVYKALKAQVDAAIEAGREVPAEQAKLLASMEAELNTGKGKDVTTAAGAFFQQVSTTITNFAQDTAKILFDGDMSWGEKFTKIWQNAQAALVSLFVEPATKALSDFVSGVLADLIGGKGFGGIFERVKDIGDTVKDIFGAGASTATTAVGGAASGAGGAGGGAASAGGSAASGVLGIVNAITGVATAVSSIIGNFQMMGMNKSLDIIVLHTLQTANDLANLRRDEWDRETHLMLKLDDIWGTVGVGFNNLFTRAGEFYDLVNGPTNGLLARIAAAVEAPGAMIATQSLALDTAGGQFIIHNHIHLNGRELSNAITESDELAGGGI